MTVFNTLDVWQKKDSDCGLGNKGAKPCNFSATALKTFQAMDRGWESKQAGPVQQHWLQAAQPARLQRRRGLGVG